MGGWMDEMCRQLNTHYCREPGFDITSTRHKYIDTKLHTQTDL